MTQTDRQVWYALGAQMYRKGWTLCTFCRFSEWDGSSCNGGWARCNHPLPAVYDRMGDDCFTDKCWGFLPNKRLDIQLAADCVGVILQGYYPDWCNGEREPTPHEVRVFDRLVAIGELKPYVLA